MLAMKGDVVVWAPVPMLACADGGSSDNIARRQASRDALADRGVGGDHRLKSMSSVAETHSAGIAMGTDEGQMRCSGIDGWYGIVGRVCDVRVRGSGHLGRTNGWEANGEGGGGGGGTGRGSGTSTPGGKTRRDLRGWRRCCVCDCHPPKLAATEGHGAANEGQSDYIPGTSAFNFLCNSWLGNMLARTVRGSDILDIVAGNLECVK